MRNASLAAVDSTPGTVGNQGPPFQALLPGCGRAGQSQDLKAVKGSLQTKPQRGTEVIDTARKRFSIPPDQLLRGNPRNAVIKELLNHLGGLGSTAPVGFWAQNTETRQRWASLQDDAGVPPAP